MRRRSTRRRAAPIDLTAAVGRADGDGERVGGGDETRLAVPGARRRGRAARARGAVIPIGRRAMMLQPSSAVACGCAKSSR